MPSFRDRLRAYLGTDTNPRIEEHMANEILTLLNGLVAQTSELSATQQASVVNIHNGFERMNTSIRDLSQQLADALANDGKVTPEMQAAADQIQSALADIKKGAETADDDFEPVEAPTEPTDPNVPSGPVDGGDTPVVTDPIDGTPVDETPTVPVEDVPAENARKR
jgi:hypothetical protein